MARRRSAHGPLGPGLSSPFREKRGHTLCCCPCLRHPGHGEPGESPKAACRQAAEARTEDTREVRRRGEALCFSGKAVPEVRTQPPPALRSHASPSGTISFSQNTVQRAPWAHLPPGTGTWPPCPLSPADVAHSSAGRELSGGPRADGGWTTADKVGSPPSRL